MSSEIQKIKPPIDSQDMENILEHASKNTSLEDIQKLAKDFPKEFVAALAASVQGIKYTLSSATGTQIENIKGLTDIQMEIIKSVTNSLQSVEETIKLLATSTESDSFKSDILKVTLELAKLKLEVVKNLKDINDTNNNNRLEIQKDNNQLFQKIGAGLLTLGAIVVAVASKGRIRLK